MSYEPINIDHHGVPTFTLPDLEQIRFRPLALVPGLDAGYVLEFGPLHAYPDLAKALRLQHQLTAGLTDAKYGRECLTPEEWLRKGGAA